MKIKRIAGIVREKQYIIIELIFSTLISWLIFHVAEEAFEVPRYYWLYLTSIAVMVYIAYLRGIKLNDWKAWLFILAGTALLAVIWKAKGINADNYGVDYSKVVRLRQVCYVAFTGLLLDLLRHRPSHIKESIKSPLLWLYLAMVIIGVICTKEDAIPLVIPIFTLLLTKISPAKWTELMDCLGAGYYLVYFKMFTASLLSGINRAEDGRYMGVFANQSTTGVHVTIAVLWGVYFFIRWLRSSRDKKRLIVLLILWVYPCVVSLMVNSRSSELGLMGAVLVAFAFLHNKSKRATKRRVLIAAAICVVGVVFFVILAKVLAGLCVSEKIGMLPYGLDHVALFGMDYPNGYFNSQLLNKINALSSQRLIDWVELIEQAKFIGGDGELLYTHNVYVFYIIKYGYLGGGLMIAWAVTYVIMGMVRSGSKEPAFIMSMIYGAFALLAEVGMNGYWMLPLGFYWLIFSYPLVSYAGKSINAE